MPPPEITLVDHVEITGNRIAARIKALKLTQEEASKRTGLTVRQLQRAMRGDYAPHLTAAFALAAGLATTIEDLFIVKIHRYRIRSS